MSISPLLIFWRIEFKFGQITHYYVPNQMVLILIWLWVSGSLQNITFSKMASINIFAVYLTLLENYSILLTFEKLEYIVGVRMGNIVLSSYY